MKFTEAQLEKAIIDLLGREDPTPDFPDKFKR